MDIVNYLCFMTCCVILEILENNEKIEKLKGILARMGLGTLIDMSSNAQGL